MSEITKIQSRQITDAVGSLCKKAACFLPEEIYKALERFDCPDILQNAHLAYKIKRPICQDTGIVVVFVEVGQNVIIEGDDLNAAINQGVEKAYTESYFRKSVVKDPLDRKNTGTNTPAIIHTQIVPGDKLKISVMLKGAGSENMSALKMLKPAEGEQGIIDFVVETVRNAGTNPCPPVHVGIGVGGTMEYAPLLAKKALLRNPTPKTELEKKISQELKDVAFGVSVETYPCHIASLPVAVNINCHAARHAEVVIGEDIEPVFEIPNYEHKLDYSQYKRVNLPLSEDLNPGDKVLLTGELYTARDAAHKKMLTEGLPFDIKGQTIYYTGPCPATSDEIIGPAGPTTSGRMDTYTPKLLELGLKAMIGKGQRNQEIKDAIKKHNAVYFTTTGGAACLLQQKIKSVELVAYPELGPEAVYKLKVEDFPVVVENV